MAETLNWINKNERVPTADDCKSNYGTVYVVWSDGLVDAMHFSQVKSRETVTHWLPFHDMPVPKRWRTPTIHDLAKAGKPIPCRWKMNQSDAWTDSDLFAVSVGNGPLSFYTLDGWKQLCEICDE